MVKRVASAGLWFLAVGWGFNYVGAMTGASPIVGMAVAAAVSAFVGIDPLHLVWPARAVSPVSPAPGHAHVSGAVQTQG
jgi:hypothetical protein